MQQQVAAMSYVVTQFKKTFILIPPVIIPEVTCLHDLFQQEPTLLLIHATYQILFLQPKLSIQHPHHRLRKSQHPERLQSLSYFRDFCAFCVTILKHEIQIHHLPQTNTLKQEVPIDMCQQEDTVKLCRRHSKPLLLQINKALRSKRLIPFRQLPIIEQIPHQRRPEVQLHLSILKYRIVESVIRQIIRWSSSLHIVADLLITSLHPYIDIPALA